MSAIAEQYPVRDPQDPWYKPAPRILEGRDGDTSDGGQGWTRDPGYADPSYGVGDGKGVAFVGPEAFLEPDRCIHCDTPRRECGSTCLATINGEHEYRSPVQTPG